MFKSVIVSVILILVSGCASTIEAFYNRQVVEDQLITDNPAHAHEIGTLAVTAQRRLIIANLNTGNFCSEPPPEAVDSVTSAIAAALTADISSKKDVSAEIASNFARHVNQLYKRSHTVQLFRDASFYLCVDAVNSSNGSNGYYIPYQQSVTNMVSQLLPVLQLEISAYYAAEKARAEHPASIQRETIVCDSGATLSKGDDDTKNVLSTNITCRPLSNSPSGGEKQEIDVIGEEKQE
ncbi:MAG: hypothetical protein KDI33_20995 [Halioglobus sp.]|nr:hypothetical protein [Halioglobus sp.]